MRVLGYVRVSTTEQADSGLGLEAQRLIIEQECQRRGWELVGIHEDAGLSAKSMLNRPALGRALKALERGEAQALVVSKLDRLSRSLLDFCGLMERSSRKGWSLVALDLGVDTTTPAGEMIANSVANFSQFERRLIGERTKSALAVKKSQGVRLGRPKLIDAQTEEFIRTLKQGGLSVRQIAVALNEEGIPTPTGKPVWHPTAVQRILVRSGE